MLAFLYHNVPRPKLKGFARCSDKAWRAEKLPCLAIVQHQQVSLPNYLQKRDPLPLNPVIHGINSIKLRLLYLFENAELQGYFVDGDPRYPSSLSRLRSKTAFFRMVFI